MFIFKAEPHCPVAGVKVYTFVPDMNVLISDGFHEPDIDGILVEILGKISGIEFWQNGPI